MSFNGTTPSDQPEQFGREELCDIINRAKYLKNVKGTNSSWKRLFERIEDDLNTLDAFIARTEIK